MENNGWSLWHGQSVAICKAVLVRQNVRMVIRYSRSALSLQLNWVKLAIICYLLMIRWQLTAVNEQKLQFFCHLQPQSWAKSLTAKTHVTDEFHSLAQIDCNVLAIYQCLEIRLQLFTFSLSPLVGRQATSHKTTCAITLQKWLIAGRTATCNQLLNMKKLNAIAGQPSVFL